MSTPWGDRFLLVDGMSLLMRCAVSAKKMPALSWAGTDTTVLTLFIGSMVKRLTGAFGPAGPSHVAVCWEGDPARNWRYEYFPEYRASRVYSGSGSEEVKVAKEFCVAAGLRLSDMPQFEGDDMVAMWWRLARQHRPGSQVVIVSSDADLLQLLDEDTVMWSPDSSDVYAAYMIRDMYGCDPERLALVRALAGDVSDEIPGAPGIGIVKAAALAAGPRPVPEIIAALPEEIGETNAAHVGRYYVIGNLREPEIRPELASAPDGIRGADPEYTLATLRWFPREKENAVRMFLEGYGMRRMLSRLDSGNLPWSSPI